MAIVKMRKLSIIGLSFDKQSIIESLMRIGVVDINDDFEEEAGEEIRELTSKLNNETALTELEDKLARIKSTIDYLSKYNTEKKGLFKSKKNIDIEKYNEIISCEHKLMEVVGSVSRYDERLPVLKSEVNRYQNLIDSMQPWKELDLRFDEIGTKRTAVLLGTVPAIVDIKKMESDILEKAPESYFELVNADREQSYFVLIYHLSVERVISEILKQNGFSKVNFKEQSDTASGVIKSAKKAIKDIEKEQESIYEKIAALSDELKNLEVLYDHLTIIRDKTAVLNNIAKTESAFILEGWLPEEYSDKLLEDIQKKYECYIDIRNANEDEDHPILLKNNSFVRPFELITELFSMPNSREIDPNFILAPFYFVFFGMMLSDAAYGLLISIVTGIILLKFKPEGALGKILSLMFFGGISTFIWGALFGSWFGDIVDVLSGKAYTIPPIWFNPLNDPMRLLIWSFIFGALHLFAGIGMKGYMLIKKGKYWDALFDVGFWYLLLMGLGLLFAGGKIAQVGKYMAIAGAILLVLTQGRSEKNIIKKFLSGVLSLYNTVGFMSDVFSYSRLLALGLATGVISSVINTIGTLMGFTVPGIILMVVVFIIGHVFNLAINVLGAYVHASRLQYVEFFGKFYEGGGKPYKPFKINTKYIRLDDRRI